MKWLLRFGAALLGLILVTEDVFARAGGAMPQGGTGGGGIRGAYSGAGTAFSWVAALLVALLSALCLYAWRRTKKLKKTRELLEKLGNVDAAWEEGRIRMYVEEHFIQIQQAWSTADLDALRALLDGKLYSHWEKKLRKMLAVGERNVISEIEVLNIDFIDIKNYLDDAKDCFTVEIRASCTDELLDKTGNVKKSFKRAFTEYWTYRRQGDRFVLGEIDQVNGDVKFLLPNVNEAPV